jgi:NAD(P)-dependent dehydrogenase (short-subunit alcohol dehydrogenase family)
MKHRLILITGANGSTGAHLAGHYLNQGASLILLYHNRTDRLEALLQKPGVFALACDLRDLAKLREVYQRACAYFGRIPDSLIHTASVRSADAQYLEETNPEVWSDVFSTNLYSFTNILRVILPGMKERAFGRVVLMGSDVTGKGLERGTAYAASKAAMVNLVRSLMLENAGENLRFNAISPGPIETKLEDDYKGEYLEFRRDYFARYLRDNPAKSLCSLSEITELCDLLLSENTNNLNGQEIIL